MRRLSGRVFFTLIFILFTLCSRGVDAKVVDRIVAIVNDDVITLGDLNKLVIDRARELETSYNLSPKEAREKAESERRDLLERMIDQLILVYEARRQQIRVTEPELQEYLSAIKAQAGITSDEEFAKELEKQGYTLRKYRDEVRKKIMADKLLSQELSGKTEVPDEEVERFYQEHKDQIRSTGEEKLHLRHIFIKLNFSEEERRKAIERANEAYSKLTSGEDFESVARALSDSKDVKLGFFKTQELQALNPDIYSAALRLNPGEFSKPIETPTGYHIIKLDSKSGDGLELSDIFIAYKLSPQEQETLNRKVREIIQRIRSGEDFKELAKRLSDDEATRDKGGDLGVKSPDELDPIIRRAVEKLKPGEISGPVWTPFGVHIFKVDSRTSGTLSDFEREQIRNFLRERKFQEEKRRFIDKLKKRMFVKVML
jgi:peptidyl-prolyl cis-trans isomerase SurA